MRLKGPNNEYKNALDQMDAARTVQDVLDILRNNRITLKNNKVSGGRKTMKKRNRKQKGGFTYKTSSIRKTIKQKSTTSRNSSRNSSGNSSRTTSRRSSR